MSKEPRKGSSKDCCAGEGLGWLSTISRGAASRRPCGRGPVARATMIRVLQKPSLRGAKGWGFGGFRVAYSIARYGGIASHKTRFDLSAYALSVQWKAK